MSWGRRLAAVVAAAATVVLGTPASSYAAPGVTTNAAPLPAPRSGMEAVGLADGRVLVVGGERSPATNAVLYDPATDTWKATAPYQGERRQGHALARLADGRVLVVGGRGLGDSWGAPTAIYDPAADTWTTVASAPTETSVAVTLPDGRVLAAGAGSPYSPVAHAAVYDPRTDAWTATGALHGELAQDGAAVLEDGTVLLAVRNGPERWDPVTNQWTVTNPPVTHAIYGDVVALPGGALYVNLDETAVFTTASGTWRVGGRLRGRRGGTSPPELTALATGEVLVSGGLWYPDDPSEPEAELYDPDVDQWRDARVATHRDGAAVAAFGDGDVLLVSGTGDGTSVERFAPPPATPGAPDDPPATRLELHVPQGPSLSGRPIGVVTRLFEAVPDTPVAGERVDVYERLDGEGTWRAIGGGTTDETGYVSVQASPERTATYLARHAESASAGPTVSREVTYTVSSATRAALPAEAALAEAGDRSARVHWLPPSDEGGSSVTGYDVRAYWLGRLDASVTVDASTRSATLTGLVNGHEYDVVVVSRSGDGVGYYTDAGPVRPRADAPLPRAPVPASLCGRLPLGDTVLTGGTHVVCDLGLVVGRGSRLLLDGATLVFTPPADRDHTLRHGISVRGGEVRAAGGSVLRGADGLAGDWNGITAGAKEPWSPSVRERRSPDAVVLDGATVAHTVDGVRVQGHTSWVRLAHATVADATGSGVVVDETPARLTDVDVRRAGGDGVALACDWWGLPNDAPCPILLDGVRVDRAGGRGLSVMTDGVVGVRGAVVTNSGTTAPVTEAARFVRVTASYGDGGDVEDVLGGGNGIDAIVLDGVATRDLTWRTPVATPASTPAPLGYLVGSLRLVPGRSVTFPANSVVKGIAPYGCGECDSGIRVTDGTLDASAPGSVFTSVADAAAGLTTCPSSLATACGTEQHWAGLRAAGTSRAVLTGASVRYADTGLAVRRGPTTVTATSFVGNRVGVQASDYATVMGPIALTDVTFTGNDTAASVGTAESFAATRVTVRGGSYGISVVPGGTGACVKGIAVTDLLAENVSWTALRIAWACDPVVRHVVVRGSGLGSRDANVYPASFPPIQLDDVTATVGPGRGVDDLTGAGNAVDGVALGGTVRGGLAWVSPVNRDDDHALGYLVGRSSGSDRGLLVTGGDVTVPAGALVAVTDRYASLTVRGGSLDASAGGARFVSFTDPLATDIGCARSTSCVAREWGDLVVAPDAEGASGDLLLTGAAVRGGGIVAGVRPEASAVARVLDTTSDSFVSLHGFARAEVLRGRATTVTVGNAASAEVSDTIVTGPGRYGVRIEGDATSTVALRRNVVRSIEGPAYVLTGRMSFGPGRDVDANLGSGDSAVVALDGVTTASDTTWLSPTNDPLPHPAGYVVAALRSDGHGGSLLVPAPHTLTFPRGAVAKVAGGGISLRGGRLDATAGGLVVTTLGDDSVGVATCRSWYAQVELCGTPDPRGWYAAMIDSGPSGTGPAGGMAFDGARIHGSVTARGPAGDAPGTPGVGLAMDESFAWSVEADGTPASLTRTHVAHGRGVSLAHSTGNAVRDVVVEDGYFRGIELDDASGDVRETEITGTGGANDAPGGLYVHGTSAGTFACLDVRGNFHGVTATGIPVTVTDSVLRGNASPVAYDLNNDATATTQRVWWGQAGGPVAGQVKDPTRHTDQAPAAAAPACAVAGANTPPAAPLSVAAAARDGGLAVTWAAPYATGRTPVTAYRVTAGSTTVEVPGSARSATVAGLANFAAYRVTVTAVNAAGEGPPSIGAGGTPSPLAPPAARVATALRASAPAVISYGGTAVVVGTLTKNGAPLPGHRVDVLTRKPGTTVWTRVTTLTTSSAGEVRHTLRPAANVEVLLTFGGTSATLPSRAQRTVQVRPVISAGLSQGSAPLGTTVAINGRVAPSLPGRRVRLEVWTGSGWRTAASMYLTSTSTYRFTVRPSARGTYSYRVVHDATYTHARAVSPTRVLKVT
ncbi:MAG TPA: fibronectin type III domain-containing protein [Frankiaceae bacterium]|jgi:hypothetical protein|nr:fibronectin type III domain-containing protein [Frankiaceae bacterium]